MLHFLVLVCQTLLPVSMVLGAMLGFAWQRRLFEVRTPAKWGALLGLAAGAILAGLKMGTGFVVREYYDLAILLVMIPFELAMVAFLVRGRNMSSERLASAPMRAVFFVVAGTWTAYSVPDIFIYPSHFAVGVVQVVSSDFVFIVVGYLAGILLCALACRAAYKVCSEVPLKTLLPLCMIIVLAFVVLQAVTVSSIVVGRGFFPRYDWAMDLVIFFLNHSWVPLLCLTVCSALSGAILWRLARSAPITGENPAERRKQRSVAISRARWSKWYLFLLVTGFLVLTVGDWWDNLKVELSPPTEVPVADGKIVLPLEQFEDGHLHRFVHRSSEGVNIRYIVIKKSPSSYGVGLDACDVCGAGGGYYERKGQVVCILCDVVMNKSTIGFAGGCNPVPLTFEVKDGAIVIDPEDLEAESARFY